MLVSLSVSLIGRLAGLGRRTLTHQEQGGRTANGLLPWCQAGGGMVCLEGREIKRVLM